MKSFKEKVFGFLEMSDNDEFETLYDAAKNEFLESLWDVISQHFDDKGTKNAL